MKNSWKWILGIVLVLVVAAGLFGLGFIHHTQMVANISQSGFPPPQMGHGSMHGGFPGGMMPHGRAPMMEMRGFGRGGGMLFGLFGRLIPLALLLLVLYGAYRLGKGRSAPVVTAAAPAPPADVPASHPCLSCGNTVQDDWKHCPNCGAKQE